MTTDAPLGRTRWLDPDSDTVTAALLAYHGTDEAWREPWRTKQGENDERHRMALALETALPEPKARRLLLSSFFGGASPGPNQGPSVLWPDGTTSYAGDVD
jgi:hypothetical protein